MSYILEAIKKSDQQRQRRTTPTLPEAQITVAAPRQILFAYYGLFALVLLGTGITIGWLHPWQAEQSAYATEPIAAKSPISNQAAQTLLPDLPEITSKTTRELPTPRLKPTRQPDILAPVKSVMHTSAPMPEKPTNPAGVALEQSAAPLTELPLPIQQEIPTITVQLHAYSSKPMNRLVSINSRMLHEGELLMPGLRLEQITPDGMIFKYKGYRFQHGIR